MQAHLKGGQTVPELKSPAPQGPPDVVRYLSTFSQTGVVASAIDIDTGPPLAAP
jgi:hypothetical protein